jgi:hypothetical protein
VTDENTMNSLKKYLDDCLKNNYFIIPFSNPISYYKTIKANTIPVVYFNITNTLGHYKFMRPDYNIIHDLRAHNNWPIKNNLLKDENISKFEITKPFFDEYEKLQTTLDKDLLNYLNYFVFSKVHEDDVYYWERCIAFLSVDKCEKMDDKNIFEAFPLHKLMFIVKMLSLNANPDSLKQIFVNKSSVPLDANKEIHTLNYVMTDADGTTKVLGTQEHPEYIPLNILAEIIGILDSLFTRLNLYTYENTIEPIPAI